MFERANNIFVKTSKVQALSLLSDESFSKSLYKNCNLLRIVLHRSIENNIVLNKWYRIDLKLVTEMGLLMDQHPHFIHLTCKLLIKNKFNLQHLIDTRPIAEDAWDPEVAQSEGFHCYKPIGGIEYRINASAAAIQSTPFYITLITSSSVTTAAQILPLTVGPIFIAETQPERDWYPDNLLEGQQYRALQSCLSESTYFLLKEQWNDGTPGKIWDSAIVMTKIFLKLFANDSNHLSNKRILDLSAGTGYIGLSIAQFYQSNQHISPPQIILTDLPEALNLMEQNQLLNHIQSSHLDIVSLCWGNKMQAQDITNQGPLDIIIASDVLYNVVHFSSLISTLRHLCHQNTIVYLCYKQRGLTAKEENSFFSSCKKYFSVRQLKNIEQLQLKQFENTMTVRIYKLQLHSQPLWGQLLLKLTG
ncbi:putative methyltransferase-domain-containing protein [Thamnidium elegans]|uniref:Methyltransferase-domain-containing protein n=1 Tax=Thamnidium elegans TaxID=101142 RepID=A0A8H7ST60_9FUNG|nr:hypothetical protein INT48_006190 [Thamnidium elegans]KAI8077201.1 putative methyltransferase-domain-containing protein [Thamnidium elegans]